MQNITILALLFSSVLTLSAQPDKSWWKVDMWKHHSYYLPGNWASDPFSTSSVCDCPGTINDNREWDDDYIGMVVYAVNEQEKLDSENRQQVWGYRFVPEGDLLRVDYNGIAYLATYGQFNGMKGNPKVWQLTSFDTIKDKERHFIIYFWAQEKVFDKNMNTFVQILETFERKKFKR